MILQLIRAAVLLSASVVVHALGTVAIVRPVRRHYLGPDRRALHRPVALGRKNSLFAGSNGGACHWAIVASLVATAKLNGVERLAWLTDVLARMVSGRTKAHALGRRLPWT